MSADRELTTTQEMFGRRLRPFWGQSPSQMIMAGLFRGVLYGVLCWAVLRLAFDTGFVDDSDITDTLEQFSWLLVAVAALLAVAVLYNVFRLVMGVLGLVTTHAREGTVVDMRHRHRGDFLPGPVREILAMRRRRQYRSGERGDSGPRRTRYELVIQNERGVSSYVIRSKLGDPALVGRRVRLTVSGYNGYVRKITPLDAAGMSPQPGSSAAEPDAC